MLLEGKLMDHMLEFIKESKKLMNYAMCVEMATGYKVGNINIDNYSRLLQEAEREVRSVDKNE
ncbi:TPA: hypothetical protein MMJ96_000123 [Clostridium botulinum]|nr:hypothetical protein [Clostridium botulinum]MBY6919465.1 hypothetical protein [Clostridium botulinum]NFL46345.1 hypothetical protein [Clostridium botulinum]NFR15569.1 hypothetical protein [Clostridium botulinum]HBZ6635751.1 hypothetical protein [Clostridium botulinum]